MSQEPKKRHSRARQGKRRARINLAVNQSIVCPKCGQRTLPHMVCPKCGSYKGIQVVKQKQTKPRAES